MNTEFLLKEGIAKVVLSKSALDCSEFTPCSQIFFVVIA